MSMDRNAGKVSGKLIAFCVIMAIGFFLFSGPVSNALMAKRFPLAQLEAYEALFSRDDVSEHEPYRTGKVVLVVPTRWSVYREGNAYTTQLNPHSAAKKERAVDPARLDENHFRLDASIRASSPEEVETVILCNLSCLC